MPNKNRIVYQNRSKGNNVITEAFATITNFYKRPLRKALHRLNDKGDTYQVIADTVFDGEVTKQNVYQTYFKEDTK